MINITAIRLGYLAAINDYVVTFKGNRVNLINLFDGQSTGYLTVDDAVEYLNCL